jgi:hypothetical protein
MKLPLPLPHLRLQLPLQVAVLLMQILSTSKPTSITSRENAQNQFVGRSEKHFVVNSNTVVVSKNFLPVLPR